MNTPNKITIFRILMVPLFLVVYGLNVPFKLTFCALIFAIASATDAVDGYLARKNKIVTNFGKFLDPIADKMLVTAGFLVLMRDGLCELWIVMLMLSREFAVTSVRLIAAAQNVVIPANIGGKIKTVLQMFSLIGVMLLCELNAQLSWGWPMVVISNVLLCITTIISVVSGLVYIFDSRKLIDFKK